MAEAAVMTAIFLLENTRSFLGKEGDRVKNVQVDIEIIKEWLNSIQACLSDTHGKVGTATDTNRARQLRDIAEEIEDALDEFQLEHVPHFHQHTISKMAHNLAHPVKHHLALREFPSKIEVIKQKTEKIINFDRRLSPVRGSSSCPQVEANTGATNQIQEEGELVGFEEHKEKLMEQLLGAETSCTISVVGPAGSGKSFLVKSVCKDKDVVKRYDCHAWIHVSQSFNKDEGTDELLWRMLGQFSEEREKLFQPGIDVRGKLKHFLKQRSYLVVLDDVWSKDHLQRIVNELPSDFGRGRIIITTRNSSVTFCVRSEFHVHKLKALSWPDSWYLFCKKAFPSNEKCPKELMDLSQTILTRCEGIPFAIVAVGSLLSRREKTPYEFKKLLDSLGSDLSVIGKILQPSYQDLLGKSNLQSCFLYFSIFPEDYSVKRGRLIRLWIAEGFIQKKTGKTTEMVAEDCLNELIGRNLVDVCSMGLDGRVSTCRVLSLVREFLIQKSQEENFVTILAEPSTSRGEKARARRLSVQCSCSKLSQNKALDFSSIRTFVMFESSESISSKVSKLLKKFRFLKVLDLEGAPLEVFPKEITMLTLLKYLSLKETKIRTIPKSIKKLAYLETLNLKHTYVTKLPSEILAFKYLRHLLAYRYNVENYVTFDSVQGVKFPAGIGTLCELQKLSLLKVNSSTVIEELGALTNLRKLGLLGLRREDGKKLCAAVRKMQDLLSLDVSSTGPDEYLMLDEMVDCPRFLQRLFLKGRLEKLPGWIFSTPLDSLVRVHLKGSKLNAQNNPLTALEALPNLLELEMVDSYKGAALEFKAESFMKLKILHIEEFEGLNVVVVEETAMPKLEKLTICKCGKLELPPLGISMLTHLQELLLYDMNKSFLDRLRKGHVDRVMVDHIKIIHSFTLDSDKRWSFENLS